MPKQIPLLFLCILLVLLSQLDGPLHSHKMALGAAGTAIPIPSWQQLSTTWGDLPVPSVSTQQTASLVADIDTDGRNDFVIAVRRAPGPSLVWYQRHDRGWTKHVIEQTPLNIEAGGTVYDIDSDGDPDIVMGGDNHSNQIWWWENPYPNYPSSGGSSDGNSDGSTDGSTGSWTRRLIKDGGAKKHHDQIFGDFDGDGKTDFVFWNQTARELRLAELPANPRSTSPWSTTAIYRYSGIEHEGLAKADMDGDGILDIIGGGRWFNYVNGEYKPNLIDDTQRFSRAAVGQLIPGGRPEVIFVCGDCVGPLRWYEWDGTAWIAHELLPADVDHGHTLELGDINADGFLDIFVAEMRVNGGNEDAATWLFLGDGTGNFVKHQMTTGFGHHESRLADLDGDGDLDILGKPYNWETPRIDIWLNQTDCTSQSGPELTQWRRHLIDDARPWRSLFITSADVNQDGYQDLLTGGWWYANPGTPAGAWSRNLIGEGLNNLALIDDFDGNGTIDVLGTVGRGSQKNSSLRWAQNDGQGNFTIHDNIAAGDGDFLQGVARLPATEGAPARIVLSWHDEQKALQQLTIPADPVAQPWSIQQLSNTTQGEELSAADIDRDGDQDLMLGTQWLRNEGGQTWSPFTLVPDIFPVTTVQTTTIQTTDVQTTDVQTTTVPAVTMPDRHRLVDLNGDGRLDVIVGFESTNTATKLAWYAQPADATQPWPEHLIDEPIAPMSLDLRDMDGDGDWDIIVGEHNTNEPANAGLYIYENLDGAGGAWQQHLVHRGDEHHDGAQTVDIDNDGDWDIISIGWSHDDVLLYENRDSSCQMHEPTPTTLPTLTVSPTATSTSTPPLPQTSTPTHTPQSRVTPELPTSTATPTVVPPATATATSTPTATPTATPTVEPLILPIIKRQPVDRTVLLGDDVTFGVDVTVAGAVTFQWYRNTAPIQNTDQPTYTLTNVSLADNGILFSCAVTNAMGTIQSQPARLQVLTGQDEPKPHRAYLPYIVSID